MSWDVSGALNLIWICFFFSFLKLDHLCQARSIQRVLSATSGKYSVVLHHQLALLSITVRSHRLGLETENWKLTLDFETLQRQVLKNPWMRHWYTDKIQKENQGFYKHAQSFRVPVAGNGFVDFHLLVQSKLETGPVFFFAKAFGKQNFESGLGGSFKHGMEPYGVVLRLRHFRVCKHHSVTSTLLVPQTACTLWNLGVSHVIL